jgi:hypothetical protein
VSLLEESVLSRLKWLPFSLPNFVI